jgi:glycosyltransferase involved in cell wall biosynthesis
VTKPLLKVVHLTPTFFSKKSVIGGGERYVSNLAKALKAGANARSNCVRQTIVSVGEEEEQFTLDDVNVRILKNASPHPGNMDGLSADIWRELSNAQLVHIHQSLTIFGAFCISIARTLNLPAVGTDHGGGDNEAMLFGRALELYDGLVSVSEYSKSLTRAYYSGPHKSLIGPADTDFFKPDPSAPKQTDLAICVGRLLPHKGVDRIIDALPDQMKLLVVGQPYDPEYYNLLQQRARGKQVKFIHDADDGYLLKLYQQSSLFIQASTHKDCYGKTATKPELMGITTLEAMSVGLPCVVSDAGSLPELIAGNPYGFVFRDDSMLKEILNGFCAGQWPLGEAQSLSRQYSLSRFSYEIVGAELLEFYEQITALRIQKLNGRAA